MTKEKSYCGIYFGMNQEYKKYLIWHSKVIALALTPVFVMFPIGRIILGQPLTIHDLYFAGQVYCGALVFLFGTATIFGQVMRKINNEPFGQENIQ